LELLCCGNHTTVLQHHGQRYCINSAALRLIPVENLVANGYARYRKLFE
jgi:peptide methionine sulfoxide reductase MsrB